MILNASPGIGPNFASSRLMENFKTTSTKKFDAAEIQNYNQSWVGRYTIDSMRQILKSKWIDKERQKLQQLGGYFVHNDEIPENLAQLNDSPLVFIASEKSQNFLCVSIVGTRVPSLYGKKFARKISYELANAESV